MANKTSKPSAKKMPESITTSPAKAARRKIPGSLPYTSSPGVLKRVLDKIPVSEKPSVFTYDFLGTVMGASGGAAMPVIPILKTTGILNAGGIPTELYAQFQSDGTRPSAAVQALKHGFPEIFKRNQFAHRAKEDVILDLIVQVTGLPKTDQIVRYILSTFQLFQGYTAGATDAPAVEKRITEASNKLDTDNSSGQKTESSMNLVYNINVVLPETTNIDVFNSIFKSLKGNLLS